MYIQLKLQKSGWWLQGADVVSRNMKQTIFFLRIFFLIHVGFTQSETHRSSVFDEYDKVVTPETSPLPLSRWQPPTPPCSISADWFCLLWNFMGMESYGVCPSLVSLVGRSYSKRGHQRKFTAPECFCPQRPCHSPLTPMAPARSPKP